jgi:UDP-N-acetylmuramate dehydrogenase
MQLKENISLKLLNTFRVGGEARYFVEAETKKDLQEAVEFASTNKLALLILGGGSNVLISDEGFPGLVLKINLKGIQWLDRSEDVEVQTQAGEDWDNLVSQAVERNLFGLENLSGIPGSVGGAPVQNIGAYGTELKEVLNWVEVFNIETKKFKKLSKEECQFDYRGSIFKKPKGKKYIITEVSMILQKKGELNLDYKDVTHYFSSRNISDPSLKEVRQAILEIRGRKFPDLRKFGTAGSFFKNPIIPEDYYKKLLAEYPNLPSYKTSPGKVKIPLAWIIDNACNLKGLREGEVGVSEKQAVVLVNYGEASASDIKELSEKIRQAVKEKTGIETECEVTLL